MATQPAAAASNIAGHGAARLAAVEVDCYNAELRDEDGFLGERASGRAFRAILQDGRERVRQVDDEDPFGDVPSSDARKKTLNKLLVSRDPEAASVVLGTIGEFAQEFATVIRRFPRLARVVASDLWRHADDQPDRKGALARLAGMLQAMIKQADKQGLKLAPSSASAAPA